MSGLDVEKLNKMALERGTPYKVLIVDDERWVQNVFKDFCELTDDAIEVELANNGYDAIEKAKNKTYDLITLDLIMPEMSGLDVLTEIKKISPHVPVMIITGNATDKIINEAGVLGACRVMYKPVKLEYFLSELTATLLR